MDALDFLASDSYIIYNKELAKAIGVESAIVFGLMCSYQRSYKGQEFYKDEQQMVEDSGLSLYLVRQAREKLKDLGLLTIEQKGMPRRNYYKVIESGLFAVVKNLTTSSIKFDTTSSIKFDTTSSIKNDTAYNNKDNNKYNNKDNNPPLSPQREREQLTAIYNSFSFDDDVLVLGQFIKEMTK